MAAEALVLREDTSWGVRLTLNRPDKLNEISADLRDALSAAVAAAVEDERVRVIAIVGAGRAFCAGYDLSEGQPGDAWGWREVLARDVEATLAIWRCPKPVIAQVHGYALAGGLELAMACDLIVAADDAQLGEPQVRFGSAPVTLLLPFLIGQKRTRELLLTGDLIDPRRPHRKVLPWRPAPNCAACVRPGPRGHFDRWPRSNAARLCSSRSQPWQSPLQHRSSSARTRRRARQRPRARGRISPVRPRSQRPTRPRSSPSP